MTGPRPRRAVLEVSPYVGGESRVQGANRVIKLSSNEGAFGPPPGVRAAVARAVDELHRYPDG
ncbi:MAG: histidinol-phosphate transaminase, partial [Acetobacteraceae bacterium]|nr:histidinol-phosphate transaminase [Acetobacteraceae bacterium]